MWTVGRNAKDESIFTKESFLCGRDQNILKAPAPTSNPLLTCSRSEAVGLQLPLPLLQLTSLLLQFLLLPQELRCCGVDRRLLHTTHHASLSVGMQPDQGLLCNEALLQFLSKQDSKDEVSSSEMP